MSTLWEWYTKDFGDLLNIGQEHHVRDNATGDNHSFQIRIHFDFRSGVKFVSLFLPKGINPIGLIRNFMKTKDELLKFSNAAKASVGLGRLPFNSSTEDLKYSGRLYVYTEEGIDENESNLIVNEAQKQEFSLVIRNEAYLKERERFAKPEAFISHDSRDKTEVAEEIVIGLQKLMCNVWYDEFALDVGDSLRESIEKGIKETKYCVVILSPNFITNNGWTKAEFDSIYTREIMEGKNFMLPVWHNITKEEVYDYCPRLIDKVAANTSEGMDEVVKKLFSKIQKGS